MTLSLSLLCLGIYVLTFVYRTESACSLPSGLTGIWWDSRINGAITITSQQVTDGWRLDSGGNSLDTYTCIESDDQYWVFRSDQKVPLLFGVEYYGVFCLQYTNITENSYRYYLKGNKVQEFGYERLLLVAVASISTFTTIEQYCSPTSGPDDREYNVLVKKDMQSTIHLEDFPDPLLGVYYYTVDVGTNTFCGAGSVLDACFVNNVVDRTVLSINYTQCPTPLMGSSSGVLFHVASVYYGTTYYVTLVNSNGQDNLFTCIAVSQTGNGLSASTNPGGCAEGQISTNWTSDPNSHLLSMTAYETCLVTTTTSTTTTTTTPTTTASGETGNNDTGNVACSSSGGSGTATAIVAAVFSILLLIAIIIIAYLIYRNMKSRRAKINHRKSTRGSISEKKIHLPLMSDFTLSDHPKRAKKSKVENDIIIEPTTPNEEIGNLWNESFNGSLTPIAEGTRPPTSTLWTTRSGSSDHNVNMDTRKFTKLPDHSKPMSSTLSRLITPLPPIHKH